MLYTLGLLSVSEEITCSVVALRLIAGGAAVVLRKRRAVGAVDRTRTRSTGGAEEAADCCGGRDEGFEDPAAVVALVARWRSPASTASLS